jgi:hypothetical protein
LALDSIRATCPSEADPFINPNLGLSRIVLHAGDMRGPEERV